MPRWAPVAEVGSGGGVHLLGVEAEGAGVVEECPDGVHQRVDVARAEGRRLAEEVRARLGDADRRPAASRRRVVLHVLRHHGFEPGVDDGTVILRNCPFHSDLG